MPRMAPNPSPAPLASLSLALALALSCDHREIQPPAPIPAPKIAPSASPDPRRIPDFSAWKSLGPARPSHAGPHRGAFQVIYLNPVAAKALDQNSFNPWPDGSQLLKEALDGRKKRLMFFWMSREQGQWVWATGDLEGRVSARFPGESSGACAACHTARTAQFGGAFTPGLAGKGTLPDIPAP